MIEVKVAILDDDLNDQQQVINYFNRIKDEQIEFKFVRFENEQKEIYQDFDMHVIDIELGNENGLEIATKIREKDPDAIILLYSKRNDLVFESFKIGCFFFIRKDYFDDDMQYAYERLRKHFISSKQFYRYESKGIIRNIAYDSIEFIEKIGHQIEIHLENGEILIERKTLKTIMNEISTETFIQCHQSYYVNLSKVRLLEQNNFIMENAVVQISQRYYMEVKKKYIQYLSRCVL